MSSSDELSSLGGADSSTVGGKSVWKKLLNSWGNEMNHSALLVYFKPGTVGKTDDSVEDCVVDSVGDCVDDSVEDCVELSAWKEKYIWESTEL